MTSSRKQPVLKRCFRSPAILVVAASLLLGASYTQFSSANKAPVAQPEVAATQPAPGLITKLPSASTRKPAPAPISPAPARPVPAATPRRPAANLNGTKPQPVVTPAPDSSVSGLAPVAPATPPSSPSPAAPSQAVSYTSTNWSGYLATNGSFTSVSGSWTATSPTGNGVSTSADSSWIGIGGVSSGDLIQTGTQNIVSASGQVTTSAFYELLPASATTIPSMAVSQGDSMAATINQTAAGQWSISITDRTSGKSFSIDVAYSSSLSSAEWIEEDPSYASGSQIPFDNFHTASFSGGSTTLNGSSTGLIGANALPVTMVTRSGTPVATPSALSGSSFTVSHS